jgi:hypothetical protein
VVPSVIYHWALIIIRRVLIELQKKNWMEGIRKAMNERNLQEGQWEDRKQWNLGVGQCGRTF